MDESEVTRRECLLGEEPISTLRNGDWSACMHLSSLVVDGARLAASHSLTASQLLRLPCLAEYTITSNMGDQVAIIPPHVPEHRVYKDTLVQGSSRLHAGDVYGNVVHNYASQDTAPNHGINAASLRPYGSLVPVGSAIHQEFVRAAAEGQHTARLRYLLAQGADIDSWDYDGLTSLHYAACRGDLENVRLLLSSGADVNSQHHDSGTPLSIAALKGHADVVEALLSHNARLDEGGGVMGSAIHCACFSGNIAIVKSLLDRGATLDRKVVLNIWALSERAKKRDASAPVQAIASSLKRESLEHRTVSCSPILLLADRCHFELLSLCWKGYKTQPPCSPNDTWSVLKQYELFGYPKPKPSVWLLLKSLGFPIQTELPQNRTLLMWAAASLNYDLIDHLLLAGASINAQDKYGWSALHYAASPFREATFDSIGVCVQRLVKGGANVDMLDRLHRTPLMLAIDKDHPALNPGITSRWGADLRMRFVKAFLDNSGREDMEPNASNSVLPHAIASDCPPEIIELLCKHGAALDVKDADGLTPLTLALLGPRAEAVTSILLQHGADPNMMNDKPVNPFEVGQPPTPLLVAIDNGCPPGIVSALLAYGAYPGLGTHLGCTASGLAEKRGMPLAPLLEAAKAAPTPMNRSWLQRVYELPSSVVRT